jgi:hypothetical protein
MRIVAPRCELSMSNLIGPEAPHWFRICHRKHLGMASDGHRELDVVCSSWDGAPAPDGQDVVMTVKDRMASPIVSQVLLLIPAQDVPDVRRATPQPQGKHDRRLGQDDVKGKVVRAAQHAFANGTINAKALSYLVGWANGTRRRAPRPAEYQFLNNRASKVAEPRHMLLPPEEAARRPPPRQVVVIGCSAPMPEENDDAEPGALVVVHDPW